MNVMLEIRDMRIRRAGRIVLVVDQLVVHKGDILAVVGSNGSGKSTLLLALAHLLKTEKDCVLFDSAPVSQHHDLPYRRRIGLVMQDALLLNRSVFRNAAIGLHYRGFPREQITRRVDTWLERLGISHLRDRPATQISGGEARRVALARAFVLQPDLLLLDEPFSALDRASRLKLQADLKDILTNLNITTLFTTHSEMDVQKIADRKIELEAGRLVS